MRTALLIATCAALASACTLGSRPRTKAPETVPYVEQLTPWDDARRHEELGPGATASAATEIPAHIELSPKGPDAEHESRYTTGPIESSHPFRDLLVSWNVDCPAETGFCVELRVAADANAAWTPWMYLGDWGDVPSGERTVVCQGGKVDTDYFRGERTFERAQLRIRAFSNPGAVGRRVVLQDLYCCASDPRLQVPWAPRIMETMQHESSLDPLSKWKVRLPVPFRSQRSEDKSISGRICSPTSLSMVLAYRGVDVPTSEVCARAFDRPHDMYGNWPCNVQAAYSYGVPGYLTRFACWTDVEELIARKQPIIASIAAKEGELRGAPYKKTDGHLLVVTGFDDKGDVCVNDPAAVDAKSGQTTYARADMQKVWLDRGGTAYVLLKKP